MSCVLKLSQHLCIRQQQCRLLFQPLILPSKTRRLFASNDNASASETLEAMETMEQYQLRKVDKVPARRAAAMNETIYAIETPALLVDKDKLIANMEAMNSILSTFDSDDNNNSGQVRREIKLRPHAKAHKCADIVQLQMKTHGQRMDGICVQTIYEAEALLISPINFFGAQSISDVYLTNICVDLHKMWRFVQLFDGRSNLKLSLTCDDIFQVHLWNHSIEQYRGANLGALAQHSSASAMNHLKDIVDQTQYLKLGIMIEINAGNRIGVQPFTDEGKQEIIAIVNVIQNEYTSNLYLRGLQIYDGPASHSRSEEERALSVKKNTEIASWALDILCSDECNNIPRNALIISGGSTGTFEHECKSGVYDEVQCGSYIYNDADYDLNENNAKKWQQSLSVLCTVLNIYDRINPETGENEICNLLDLGLKSYSTDSGLPIPMKYYKPAYILEEERAQGQGQPPKVGEHTIDLTQPEIANNLKVVNMGDEHTIVKGMELNIGGKIEFQPSHCDTTNNLYNHIVVLKNERVNGCWMIDARGPGN